MHSEAGLSQAWQRSLPSASVISLIRASLATATSVQAPCASRFLATSPIPPGRAIAHDELSPLSVSLIHRTQHHPVISIVNAEKDRASAGREVHSQEGRGRSRIGEITSRWDRCLRESGQRELIRRPLDSCVTKIRKRLGPRPACASYTAAVRNAKKGVLDKLW